MSDEPEVSDEELIELEYSPCAMDVADGSAVIGDIVEFLNDTDSVAVHMLDGQMFVLNRDSLTWMKIQDVRKSQKKQKGDIRSISK